MVCNKETENDSNFMGGRFVLSIKHVETDDPLFMERFVGQGHANAENNLLVNSAPNVKHFSIRFLVIMDTIFGYRIWTQDVAKAYLQVHRRSWGSFYSSLKVIQLNPEELLELMNPLYGLTDDGYYCHFTFAKHLQDDLSMQSLTADLTLYTKKTR